MNYQNTNICCTYPTYSTMTWSYGYYNDGTVEHAWDSTNEWFDRAYKYDHAGRLKEASTYRRARGLAPFPSNPYPDPYYQNITYDTFNHISRTGLLYSGEHQDVGTWVNNRRTGLGWQYDADGNTTVDPNFTQTFDAAGKPSHSVSFARVGDGINYPYQPSTDITQTYDGTGAPGKRVQITRQSDYGEGPPLEDVHITYYVRSTVLGAAVVELNDGFGSDIINVYAGGQRIARDESDNITFEHIIPVTGSRVTSAGHSSYRATNRQERDSFGAEIPTFNPYPGATNYGDYKFGEQFYILGGDPFDYSTGREIDGIPVSETEFQRRVGNGSVDAGVYVAGRYAGSIDLRKQSSFGVPWTLTARLDFWESDNDLDTALTADRDNPDETIETASTTTRWLGAMTFKITFVGLNQRNRTRGVPQNTQPDITGIRNGLKEALKRWECRELITNLLDAVKSKKNPVAKSGVIMDLFEAVVKQGGITRTRPPGSAGYGNPIGKIKNNNAAIFSAVKFKDPGLQLLADIHTTMHELLHLAGYNRYYTDEEFARAVHNNQEYRSRSPSPPDEPALRKELNDPGALGWGAYWNDVLMQKCFQ